MKTCAADDFLDTCRHPDTAVNISQSFPSSKTHINNLNYPAQSHVQLLFHSLSYSAAPKYLTDMYTACQTDVEFKQLCSSNIYKSPVREQV